MSLKVLQDIEKQFGKGAAFELGSKPLEKIESISTGILGLDSILGVGGFPKGRIIEIYGQEACFKTSLALQAAANVQKTGKRVALVDVEFAFDPTWARKLGVNVEELIVSQPESSQTAWGIIELLVKSGEVELIILDSIGGLVTQEELDGEIGDSYVAVGARLNGKAIKKLTGPVSNHNVCLILINQLRSNIGVMFGPEKITMGGNATKFFASQRLEISKKGQIKNGEEITGYEYKVKVAKNKVAAPFGDYCFEIYFNEGFSRHMEVLNLAAEHKIIDKSGAWYSYNSERVGQGKENSRKWLIDNPEKMDIIEKQVKQKLGLI